MANSPSSSFNNNANNANNASNNNNNALIIQNFRDLLGKEKEKNETLYNENEDLAKKLRQFENLIREL